VVAIGLTVAGLLAWTMVLIVPTAPARSGPNCAHLDVRCITHPYTDAVEYVPGDFMWMIPAFFLAVLLVLLIATPLPLAGHRRSPCGRLALVFAGIAAAVLAIDYYVQFAVVQTSLVDGELDGGLSVFSQYNPHGLFVALEDPGYFMMCLTFVFAGVALRPSFRAIRVLGDGLRPGPGDSPRC
jgi:hypothetical protein